MGKTTKKLIIVFTAIVISTVMMILTPVEPIGEKELIADENGVYGEPLVVVPNNDPSSIKRMTFEEYEKEKAIRAHREKMDKQKEKIEKFKEDQKEAYKDYVPSEYEKELYGSLTDYSVIAPRVPSYEIEELLHNPTDFESFVKIFYYMNYHIIDEVELTYSAEHIDFENSNIKQEIFDMIKKARTYAYNSYPEIMSLREVLSIGGNIHDDSATIRLKLNTNIVNRSDVDSRRKDFDKESYQLARELIDKGIINFEMSQLEMAKVLHKWVIDNVRYDYSLADTSHDGYSALVDGLAVCQGYTSLYNRLLLLFGMDPIGVAGEVISNGEPHSWTEVYLDGELYYIDPTWNDAEKTTRYFTTNIRVFEENREWDREDTLDHNSMDIY